MIKTNSMKPESILHADILDIIFDGRNKDYGAYKLRKDYELRMRKAMLAVSLLAAAMFLMSLWNGSKKQVPLPGKIIVIDPIIIAPPPAPPPPAEPQKEKTAMVENASFVLTNDPDTDTMPTVEELDKAVQIGLTTKVGDPFIFDAPPPDAVVDSVATAAEVKRLPGEEILRHAEVMPEFRGGQAAFMRFLSKNLRVPENALEPGQKIKVIVRFVVGREGELSDLEFLQTGGEVFEHEVLRVLRKMPRWNAGIQKGEKVRVYFNLPIIFDAPEQ